MSSAETTILDAACRCRDKWGLSKLTVDDIAAEARVSRATLYRLFPGGRDVLFEALRTRELEEFFTRLDGRIAGAVGIEDTLVRAVVYSTEELRTDEHLAMMLAAEPGEAVKELTVSGLPRIIEVATMFLVPLVEPYLAPADARRLVELLVRLVISYFLAPSAHLDLGQPASAETFIRDFILPAFQHSLRS